MTLELRPRDPRVHVFRLGEGPMRLARRTYLSGAEETGEAAPLAEALGAEVDPGHVEVFAAADMVPLSLRDYLAQAYDVPQEAMAADRDALDAATGTLVIVSPRAVDGLSSLEPDPQLSHLASYASTQPDGAPRGLPPAASRAARPASAEPEREPGRPLASRGVLWIVLLSLALAGLVLLVL